MYESLRPQIYMNVVEVLLLVSGLFVLKYSLQVFHPVLHVQLFAQAFTEQCSVNMDQIVLKI